MLDRLETQHHAPCHVRPSCQPQRPLMAHSPDVSLEPVVDSDFTPPDTPFVPDPTRWRALGVIAIAQLMVMLDASIVNLALPSAKAALGITDANQPWVITAYTLTFGGLLLLGGRIADYVGLKRAFIIGLIGFATASTLGGFAPSQGFLFAARGLQGAFAALLAPAALSLLGGVLTEYLSWRWCLLVNAPIAIAAVFMAIPWVHESKAEGDTRYDVAGAVTATLGVVSLVYGFTKAAPKGLQDSAHWAAPGTLIWFAAAAILLTSFFVTENRVSNPLLPMRVLLDRNRGASYLVSLITGIGLFAMFLFLGLYLQVILRYSPVKAGFAFLPFSLGIILGAGASSQLLPRVGPKPLLIPGLIAGSVGLLLLTRVTPQTSYATHVLIPMLIISVGMAFVFIPVSSTALHAISHHDAGVASAMINTSQQVGGSLGTALLNTVAVTTSAAYLTAHEALGRAATPAALTEGYTRAFAVGAGFLFTAAVVALFMLKVGKEAVLEDDVQMHVG